MIFYLTKSNYGCRIDLALFLLKQGYHRAGDNQKKACKGKVYE